MCHHTWFVQGRLPVENEHVPITQMSKHLFVDGGGPCGKSSSVSTTTVLGCEQLISDSGSLFYGQFVLCVTISVDPSSNMRYTK
jgi:hypothetical protein